MICPRWVSTEAQPIAIEDLLLYLEAALERPTEGSHIYEIGGPDRATYGEIMKEYAKQRGLKRLLISVPVLTPRLSSLWLGLVTPVYARIGRKLIESMRNPTVVHNRSAEDCFGLKPRSLEAAIGRALAHEDHQFATTRWSDAASASLGIKTWGGVQFGPRVMDSRRIELPLPPKDAFRPVQEIGGSRGWYFANWLWTLRGWIDLLCGGIGRRRGRRDPQHIAVGDTIDWWRVEQYVPGHLLRSGCGNEGSGTSMVAVRSNRYGTRNGTAPVGHFRSRRNTGATLLVQPLSPSCNYFSLHAHADRSPCDGRCKVRTIEQFKARRSAQKISLEDFSGQRIERLKDRVVRQFSSVMLASPSGWTIRLGAENHPFFPRLFAAFPSVPQSG